VSSHRKAAKQLLTKPHAVLAARLQYESADSDEGQEATRYDEVYDIVERLATK